MDKPKPQLGALRIFDGVFSEDNCADLVNVFKLNLDAQKSVEELHGLTATGYEYTRYHFEEEFHNGIIEQLAKLYGKYLEELEIPNLIAHQGMEEVLITRFRANSDDNHAGHIDVNNNADSIRAVGFRVYLTDNDGHTEFPRQGVGVEPRVGRAVVYPPTWEYPYQCKNPTNSDKYILSTYLHYAEPQEKQEVTTPEKG
jgi:hypothetical protein